MAPLLLIENYELISEFVGGDAGAFHQIFALNRFCAMCCDTVIERFIEKSGDNFINIILKNELVYTASKCI